MTGFVLRGTVRFDIGEYLKNRRKNIGENIRALCPHVTFESEDDNLIAYSSFVSPPGTTAWQCQRCGTITYDIEGENRKTQYWANNIDEYNKRVKKMLKQSRKLGL